MVKSLEKKIKSKSVIKTKTKSNIKFKSKSNNKLVALGSLAALAAIIAAGFEINKCKKEISKINDIIKQKENLNQNDIRKQNDIIKQNDIRKQKEKYFEELIVLQRELFNTKDKDKRLLINKKMLKLHRDNPN